MNLIANASEKINGSSDTLGAFASALCLIHCLATPLLFLATAHGGAHDHHAHGAESVPMLWEVLDYFFLIISALAVSYSTRNTSLKWMPALLWSSWGLLTLMILNEKLHLFHIDHIFVLIPALSLVGLHLYNRKYCNCEDETCCVE